MARSLGQRLKLPFGYCKCGCGSWWLGGSERYIVRERGVPTDSWLRLVVHGRTVWEKSR